MDEDGEASEEIASRPTPHTPKGTESFDLNGAVVDEFAGIPCIVDTPDVEVKFQAVPVETVPAVSPHTRCKVMARSRATYACVKQAQCALHIG